MAFIRWQGEAWKKIKRSFVQPGRKTFPATRNRLLLEPLEKRQVLSVTLGAITGPDANSAFDVPAGKDLYVPLIGTDVGQSISYSATSSDPGVKVSVLAGNPTLEMTVHGTNGQGQAFSGTMTFQLFENIAPQTVQGIISDVNSGLFNGAEFYRAETSPTFELIQGGIQPPTGLLSGKSVPPKLPDEFNAAATFNSAGDTSAESRSPAARLPTWSWSCA